MYQKKRESYEQDMADPMLESWLLSCIFFICSLSDLLFAYMNNIGSRRRGTAVGQHRLSEVKIQPSLYWRKSHSSRSGEVTGGRGLTYTNWRKRWIAGFLAGVSQCLKAQEPRAHHKHLFHSSQLKQQNPKRHKYHLHQLEE